MQMHEEDTSKATHHILVSIASLSLSLGPKELLYVCGLGGTGRLVVLGLRICKVREQMPCCDSSGNTNDGLLSILDVLTCQD